MYVWGSILVWLVILTILRPRAVAKGVGGIALVACGVALVATVLRVAYLVLAFIWS